MRFYQVRIIGLGYELIFISIIIWLLIVLQVLYMCENMNSGN